MMAVPRVSIQSHDFDLTQEVETLRAGDGGVGAVTVFIGTVREHGGSSPVSAMELEHYPGMTERAIESMIDEAHSRFDIRAVRVIHRIGRLLPQDQIVLVAASSAHRGAAFRACEFLMDYLKTQAPFWKKETTPAGACWVDARVADDAALARWGIAARNAADAGTGPGESASPPTPDADALRNALGRFATGVTIVTCRAADGRPIGLTVSSFNALSLTPPLVLWSLRDVSPQMADFMAASGFAVNVLTSDQQALSQRFAGRDEDRFDAGAWTTGAHGAPVLVACAAVFECATASQQDAGDHRLFIGHVLACRWTDQLPLLYHAGQYRQLGLLSP